MCELFAMDIAALRAELGLSLGEFAKLLGLASKGYVSQLERGEVRCSVPVALALERISGGRIDAGEQNADVALVRRAPEMADAAA